MERGLSTSESVTEGYPDKICDQISDAVLDALLVEDPESCVACETSTMTGLVVLMGEVSTTARIDYQQSVRNTTREIDYTRGEYNFDYDTCVVLTALHEQSPDIAQGVNHALREREGEKEWDLNQGAGDQGLVFGYACRETEELMPYPISLAHRLCRKLIELRKTKKPPYLRSGGESQVAVEYDENGEPACLDAVMFSTQHDPDVSQEKIHAGIKKYIFDEVLPAELVDKHTRFYINPAGRFVIGGPNGDAGLTRRKIIVDACGGYARHGGDALSNKDPSKVDRSAAYTVHYIAKNLVAAELADSVEIQPSYTISVATPTSVSVNPFGTGKLSDEQLCDIVWKEFDLRPAGIIRMLDLKRPIYRQTVAYGHFGREDLSLPWEEMDRAEQLKRHLA